MKAMNPAHSAALAAWPVGSVYMSVNPTSPATLFGGTWQRIQGRFPLGADDAHPAGSTGGEESHTLTVDEMPSHAHAVRLPYSLTTGAESNGFTVGPLVDTSTPHASDYTGGGQPHNNMPPYLSVYIWKRTA